MKLKLPWAGHGSLHVWGNRNLLRKVQTKRSETDDRKGGRGPHYLFYRYFMTLGKKIV